MPTSNVLVVLLFLYTGGYATIGAFPKESSEGDWEMGIRDYGTHYRWRPSCSRT
jgi:hypothetical protein